MTEETGSTAYERFTIHQILKFASEQPNKWAETERVSLISSFIPTLLVGKYAPIDFSDGSGMNCLNIDTKRWSAAILKFATQLAPNLIEKLGSPAPSTAAAG